MAVELVAPQVRYPLRVLLLGAATEGWYQATDEQRRTVLSRFQQVLSDWRSWGAVPLATLDDDLFMVGSPVGVAFSIYLIYEVPDLAVLAAMIHSFRQTVGGVRLDGYLRFEARIGRPFFLVEG